MTDTTRTINGTTFRQFRIVNPGSNLYFLAGRTVAVETWAIEWGRHEFDYELNSRGLDARGRPGAIATTRQALQREFLERRVVSRLPVPVSFALNGVTRAPDVELTLGEARPQTYTSKIEAPRLAWSLNFTAHRHHAGVGGKRSVRGAATSGTLPAGGNRLGMATSFNYLMIYLPVADHAAAQILPGGLGTTDVIGTEPGLIERWISRITGQ